MFSPATLAAIPMAVRNTASGLKPFLALKKVMMRVLCASLLIITTQTTASFAQGEPVQRIYRSRKLATIRLCESVP